MSAEAQLARDYAASSRLMGKALAALIRGFVRGSGASFNAEVIVRPPEKPGESERVTVNMHTRHE